MKPSIGKQVSFLVRLRSICWFVRLPNLIMVAATEFLIRYGILDPLLFSGNTQSMTSFFDFIIFVVATLMLSAGGYVINDYFDVKADRINRPDQLVVTRMISARHAILVHMILNAIAIILGFYLAYRVHSLWFGLLFPFLSGLFWFYSARWKQLIIWKNLVVALVTAFLILFVLLFEFLHLRLDPPFFASVIGKFDLVWSLIAGYAGFAFLTSLFREVLKDMEDIEGDREMGIRSIPVKIGILRSKILVIFLVVMTMCMLSYGQLILVRLDYQLLFWYLILFLQLPSLLLIVQVILARQRKDFHRASLISKGIMIAGILTMLFYIFI